MEKDKVKEKLLEELSLLRSKEGYLYAGLPRWKEIFGRDSLISSWQLLDFEPEIAKATLKKLSEFQGKKVDIRTEEEPGKIIHTIRQSLIISFGLNLKLKLLKIIAGRYYYDFVPKLPFPFYGTVDATPLFLILFSFYFKKTEDREFIKRYFENILSAINWIRNFGDIYRDGFLWYARKSIVGHYHQGWKDVDALKFIENHLKITAPVAIVEAQGYKYLAFKEIGELLKIFGEKGLADQLIKEAEELKKKFNKMFWMEDRKYFALGLDFEKKQRKAITSNPGHLLFTGIIDNKEKERLVVEKLFSKELWTPYGIRTHSILEPDFDPISYHLGSIWPHDNWIIAQGLRKLNYEKEYEMVKKAILKAFNELGYLPELYGVDKKGKLIKIKKACYPQAWATGALINFLGVKNKS